MMSYQFMKKFDGMLIHFDAAHKCDNKAELPCDITCLYNIMQ